LGLDPLLIWTLVPACDACDLVLVSSDDPETLELASQYRTVVHERPAELSGPRMPDWPVVAEVYASIPHEPDDVLVLLRPTAPFRRAEEIREVGNLVHQLHVDSVRSVVPSDVHPGKMYLATGWTRPASSPHSETVIHRDPPTWRATLYPYLTPSTERHRANHPRQWLQPAFRACGFVDAVRADVVVGMQSMEGDLIIGWEAPTDRAFDLDSEMDFAQAAAWAATKGWRPGKVK